jgi:hypothetical protein
MILNEKQIEQAGKEEYALWRKTKDRVNSIKEFVVANATSHINRLDEAFQSGDITKTMELFGPGGGVLGMTKGAMNTLDQIKFPKNFNIIEYFRPVKTKAQTAAAINALKHQHSNYDSVIPGIGRQDYNGVQEGFYGSLAKGLNGSKMEQTGKWVNEIYIEKMRGLGTPGF